MIPLDTDMPIPYGFPIAKTLSPVFNDELSAIFIGVSIELLFILRTAISALLSVPIILASYSSPLLNLVIIFCLPDRI